MTRSWAARIAAAEKRGLFTAKDAEDSDFWRSCAIGEKHFPPADHCSFFHPDRETQTSFWNLGRDFGVAVNKGSSVRSLGKPVAERTQYVAEAKRIYEAIQVAAAEYEKTLLT